MVEDNIYISLSNGEQRKYRSELLLTQTEILNLIKRLEILKKIRNEKIDYRLKLAREFSLVLEGINRFHEKMPTPKIPKDLLEKTSFSKTHPHIEEEINSDQDYSLDENVLENELHEIQEQLRMING